MKSLPFGVLMLLSLLISAAVSFGITPIVKRMAYKVGAMDVPKDARRMHSVPIPRLGGLAIAIAFLLTVLLFANVDEQMRGILLGAVVILVLGVLDDCLTLRAWFKFLVQIFAAYLVTSHGCTIRYFSNPIVTSSVQYLDLGKWSVPITIVWIVAITNAVNFIDGLDGLAVGVATISSLTMLVIAMLVSENVVALMMAALAGGCIGFMPYNLNPAKIFMGDTGSTFLGFVLATVSIQGLFKFYTIISFAVPFLMLGLPLFDTCFAILRRLAKGQSPMAPDRSHVHHRLIDMGFNQKQAVAILYVISAILGLSAVVLTTSGALKAMVLLCALCLAGLISGKIFLSHNENHQEKTKEKESNDHAIESHDDLRDPPGGGEDGPSGKGTGEQS